MVKKGNPNSVQAFFSEIGVWNIQNINLIVGFEEPEFVKIFEKNVKFIPTDEIMRLLIYESCCEDWNPLIYAIYYQKVEVLNWFCT